MKRQKLSEGEDDFLRGEAKPTTPPSPTQGLDMDAIAQVLKPASNEKANEQKVRLTVDLGKSLHRRLAVQATLTEKTQSQIVRELLEAVLPQLPE